MAAAKVKCLVCSGEKLRSACEIIVLTPEERAITQNPLDEYVYCKPCWKVLHSAAAPDLIRGIVYMHLKALGVGNAKELADQYKTRLLAQSRKT